MIQQTYENNNIYLKKNPIQYITITVILLYHFHTLYTDKESSFLLNEFNFSLLQLLKNPLQNNYAHFF